MSPPDGAWVKRDGDNLVIRCNGTGETWYLTCKDEEWVGDYSNCTGRGLLSNTATKNKKNFLQEGVCSDLYSGVYSEITQGYSPGVHWV